MPQRVSRVVGRQYSPPVDKKAERLRPTRGARLEARDYEAVLEVVRVVSSARDPIELSQLLVEQVARLLPSDVVTMNQVDPVAGRVIYAVEPRSFVIPPGAGEHLARHADDHPLIRYSTESGDGSARRISDFMTQAEFHETSLYEHVYRPMGVEYQIAVMLSAPIPTVVGVAASRADANYSNREQLLFEAARPHLTQAWRNAAEQHRLHTLLGVATDALEQSDSGIIVLWEPPQELTPGALVSLYRFFGRPTSTSSLPARVERWVAAERGRLHEGGGLVLAQPLGARLGNRRLVLHYLAARRDHPGAILLSAGAQALSSLKLQTLRLSAREADVVRLAVGGSTNAEIADRLTIASGTVKKHLDNVYAKLGVRGRLQLAALVHDLLG